MVHKRYFPGERGILAAKVLLHEALDRTDYAGALVGLAAIVAALVRSEREEPSSGPSIDSDAFRAAADEYTAGNPAASDWVRETATGFLEVGSEHGLTFGEYLSAVTQVLTTLAGHMVRFERYGPDEEDEDFTRLPDED
jgi:hypothetical protein